jgi:TonB family protein
VPEYPPLAKAARITGDVLLDVTLKDDGSVVSSRVISGHPLLRAAAQTNSTSWKFAAADNKDLDNEEFTLTYQFRLSVSPDCGAGPTRVTIESYNRVTVLGSPIVICDPPATVKKKHWYWPW